MSPQKIHKHPLATLLLLLLLFLIPFSIAWLMYHGHHLLPRGRSNHGTLIQPPFSMTQLNLHSHGKWMLLYFNPGLCEKTCQKDLYQLRQIRTATGKNSNRVTRALLSYPKNTTQHLTILKRFPGTQHLIIQKDQFVRVIKTYVKTAYALKARVTYLVDPLGNVILSYPPNTDPNAIFKDLQHLLKVSQIG